MQDKNNNSQPPGICNKLFNIFINNLIARGLKRVTLGYPVPPGSTQIPSGDSAMSSAKPIEEEKMHPQSQVKPKDDSASKIQVQFKQTEELEYWTPVDKLGSSAHELEKGSPIVTSDQPQLQKSDNISLSSSTTAPVDDQMSKDKATHEMDIPLVNLIGVDIPLVNLIGVSKGSTTLSQGSQEVEPDATIAVSDNLTPAIEPKDNRGKNIPSGKRTIALEEIPNGKTVIVLEPEKPKPKPHVLLHVTPNINEKSESFINRVRENLAAGKKS